MSAKCKDSRQDANRAASILKGTTGVPADRSTPSAMMGIHVMALPALLLESVALGDSFCLLWLS